jgi:CheY-like chemotaxis protein
MTTARHPNAKLPQRALVVDPDAELRSACARALFAEDFEIVHASDGREALVRVLEQRFRLLITETDLPLIDGYALCELVRRDVLIRTMPIMVVTADVRQAAKRRALQSGADAVLVKPFADSDLVAEVRRLMLDAGNRSEPQDAALSPPPATAVVPPAAGKVRGIKSRSHKRYDTTEPPVAPPILRCPDCDRSLFYTFSHIGGVSAREPEQWDYYTCPGPCGQFQYRQRTRKVQRV